MLCLRLLQGKKNIKNVVMWFGIELVWLSQPLKFRFHLLCLYIVKITGVTLNSLNDYIVPINLDHTAQPSSLLCLASVPSSLVSFHTHLLSPPSVSSLTIYPPISLFFCSSTWLRSCLSPYVYRLRHLKCNLFLPRDIFLCIQNLIKGQPKHFSELWDAKCIGIYWTHLKQL